MIRDFKTASLMDMQLPPAQKTKLWHEGIVRNPAAMNVLSSLLENFSTTESDAESIVDDVIHTDRLMKKHAVNFFSYRGNQIPPEAYYAVLARSLIEDAPEWFPYLPANYAELATELKRIDGKPEIISDIKVDRAVRFCHYIEIAIALQKFRDGLRDGTISVKAGSNKNGNQENKVALQRYNSLVPHVKDHLQQGFEIIGDIRNLTVDIDYFLNHYSDDFAWYVRLGSQDKHHVLDKDHLFKKVEMQDIGHIREAFDLAFDYYKTKYKDDPFTAYYEFCENVLSPYNVFRQAYHELNDKSAVMALTRNFSEATDGQAYKSVSRSTLEMHKAAATICDLSYHIKKMSGSIHQPFIMTTHMVDLYEKLIASENLPCPQPLLAGDLQTMRNRAIDTYNKLAVLNEIDTYENPAP